MHKPDSAEPNLDPRINPEDDAAQELKSLFGYVALVAGTVGIVVAGIFQSPMMAMCGASLVGVGFILR